MKAEEEMRARLEVAREAKLEEERVNDEALLEADGEQAVASLLAASSISLQLRCDDIPLHYRSPLW